MTKVELKLKLEEGKIMDDLFHFTKGQECLIYKADLDPAHPVSMDEIIYIPDISLNEIPCDNPITDPDIIKDVLDQCYTPQDFVDICDGDNVKAEELFRYVDWQHPSAAWDAGELDDSRS